MSSYSANIYVSDSEWDELNRKINDTNNYVAQKREEIERVRRQIESQQREIECIVHANEQLVDNVIHTMQSNFTRSLSGGVNDVGTVSGINGQLELLVNEARNARTEANTISQNINQLVETFDSAIKEAINSKIELNDRISFLSERIDENMDLIENLNPGVFARSDYERLNRIKAELANDINSGNLSAASIVAHNVLLDSTRLLARLSFSNTKFGTLLNETSDVVSRLENQIGRFSKESGLSIPVEDTECEVIDYDISHWSYGEFDRLCNRFEEIKQRFSNAMHFPMTCEEMNTIINEALLISNQLTLCDEAARKELSAYVHIHHTAENLHQSLSSGGWALEQSGFSDGDNRNPYVMNYTGPEGSNLSVIVCAGTDAEKPDFFAEVFSDNPYLAETAKRGVMASLESSGIQIDNPVERDDCNRNSTPEDFISNVVREATMHRNQRLQQEKLR